MAAPKGNDYGRGNSRSGRPLKYPTTEALHKRVYEYFDEEGRDNPTISGLTLFLGFSSRQSLYDYARKEAFSYTIKRALLVIEEKYEEMLIGPNARNAIFALKSMGWKDHYKQTINVQIKDGAKPFPSLNKS